MADDSSDKALEPEEQPTIEETKPTSEPPIIPTETPPQEAKVEEEQSTSNSTSDETPAISDNPPVISNESEKSQDAKSSESIRDIETEIQKKLTENLMNLRQKANLERKNRIEENLKEILLLAKKHPIKNHHIRDLLQVSRGTAIKYLSILVRLGKLKKQNHGKATMYTS